MIVQINENYRIIGDSTEWQTQVKRVAKEGKNKGRTTWDALGHYMDFAVALESLAEYRLRTADVDTADKIKEAIREIRFETQKAARIFAKDAREEAQGAQ